MIAVSYTVTQHGYWQVATQPCRSEPGFIAWMKRGRIEGPDALFEPGDVYFEFGDTAEEAKDRLLAARFR